MKDLQVLEILYYMLTDEEATQLQNDPRVDAVELRPDQEMIL